MPCSILPAARPVHRDDLPAPFFFIGPRGPGREPVEELHDLVMRAFDQIVGK